MGSEAMRGERAHVTFPSLSKESTDIFKTLVDDYIPVSLHESMGAPTLLNFSDDRQKSEWGPLVRQGRWLVSYAQTEMAHGSFLGGLRTTATLDRKTDEWVIHTPEMSAGKVGKRQGAYWLAG